MTCLSLIIYLGRYNGSRQCNRQGDCQKRLRKDSRGDCERIAEDLNKSYNQTHHTTLAVVANAYKQDVDDIFYNNACIKDGVPSIKPSVASIEYAGAADLARHGVRVNAISPQRVVPTSDEVLLKQIFPKANTTELDDMIKKYADDKRDGLVVNEVDVANAAVYLASDASKGVTGHNLVLNSKLKRLHATSDPHTSKATASLRHSRKQHILAKLMNLCPEAPGPLDPLESSSHSHGIGELKP
ncbi:hypothetical protein HU200_053987 [Digitaria exilis]|uniref:Uncharacterized protein n=1 Tax=Digitaria exilis TaxID=1010633 RepID=A0A835E2V7_9POAL|nr:hypothetical protein HU200_053987 [Digitaria exilis]